MIPDEAPRGRIPPPWVNSLSGLERTRLFSRGHVPMNPFARLSGIRITHVAPGGATVVSPATEASLKNSGHMNIFPTLVGALGLLRRPPSR